MILGRPKPQRVGFRTQVTGASDGEVDEELQSQVRATPIVSSRNEGRVRERILEGPCMHGCSGCDNDPVM